MKKQDNLIIWFVVFLVLFFGFNHSVYAQPIAITKSDFMKDVIFDGKWSSSVEWKHTSLNEIKTTQGSIYIRTAHLNDDIFVMLDAVSDETPSKDDMAFVCLGNIQNITHNEESNYCFKQNLSSEKPSILSWQQNIESFQETKYHERLTAIGNISDENDRHSKNPHASYEFKIPLEPIGRYERYGFFVGVFDSQKNNSFTWPGGIDIDLSKDLPSPEKWGIIFSPDKSLPEYEMPMIVLMATISIVIMISFKQKNFFYR